MRRLVHLFDFDERDDDPPNPYQMPRYWYLTGQEKPLTSNANFLKLPLHQEMSQKRGYPAYNFQEVGFDRRHRRSGEFSFHLGLRGGNVGSYLEVGTLPAVPGSDYEVQTSVLTEGLERAHAYVEVFFVDAAGNRIKSSVNRSAPLRTNGRWTPISLKLIGDQMNAAWIGIAVSIEQPVSRDGNPLGQQEIVLRDVEGGAWFDDMAVWQLPHVQIASQSPVNIIRQPEKPKLMMSVRDLTGSRLRADVRVYDEQLREVASASRRIGGGAPHRWRWVPELPGCGWYLVDMVVQDEADGRTTPPIARTIGAVLWLPEDMLLTTADARNFGVVAEGLPDNQLPLLPHLMHTSGLEMLMIDGWSEDSTLLNAMQRQQSFAELLMPIATEIRETGLALQPVPRALAQSRGVDTSDTLGVLTADQSRWEPFVAPVLRRHGQRVRSWQLGSFSNPTAFFHRNLPAELSDILSAFRAMAPQPQVVVPWRIDQSRVPLPRGVIYGLDVPPGVAAEQLPAYLAPWQSVSDRYWLYLRSSAADQVSHTQRMRDLMLRMLYAWETDAPTMLLDRPWTSALQREAALLPDPLLGVYANTAKRLAGKRIKDRLLLGDGIECRVLDGLTGGSLALWNAEAPVGTQVSLYLGEAPVLVDAWGNRSPLKTTDGKHQITLGPLPVFVENIDTELAMFRAGFRINEPFIESLQTPHPRTLTLTNPWGRTISGHMTIRGPEGWHAKPQRHHFSIASGRSVVLPVELTFPIAEVAGSKKLVADFDFVADQRYDVDLFTPLELGLSNVRFDAALSVEPGTTPGTQDVVVTCVVSNTGRSNRALYVFANLAGHPRKERIIAAMEPGESVVRRFRFLDGGKEIAKFPVRCGVRETNGPAVLNQKLSIDGVE